MIVCLQFGAAEGDCLLAIGAAEGDCSQLVRQKVIVCWQLVLAIGAAVCVFLLALVRQKVLARLQLVQQDVIVLDTLNLGGENMCWPLKGNVCLQLAR